MKAREYCCCAVPLVNAGIYFTLLEQLVLGVLAGSLSIATPHIVGASTPSSAAAIFAVICYIGAAVQLLGFFGVYAERPILFRRYTTLHLLITVGAFSLAAVWIALSGTRHSKAQTKCESDFFPSGDSITTSEGQELCNIIPWVDIGLMGGLWVILAILQLYLYVMLSSYSTAQKIDHEKYESAYDPTRPLTTDNDIPLTNRSDPWNARTSMDYLADRDNHSRQGSVSSVLGDKMQQPGSTSVYAQGGYAPAYPANAVVPEPGPTPRAMDNYYTTDYSGGMEYPERSQAHPAEGSFRRKMARVNKPGSEDYTINYVPRQPVY